jgi:hypothetical protein
VLAEAAVVDKDEKDVGRAFRGLHGLRKLILTIYVFQNRR